jgi:hypothetical protein
MSPWQNPAIEDLLADPLIQSVMRADRVHPKELRTLLQGAANRIAAVRASGGGSRSMFRGTLPSLAARPRSFGGCGATVCC